ncbi:MAG: hypothetical protein ABFD07_19960 [Methanobacterium sp.]
MPITIDKQNNRALCEFGKGDIFMTPAAAKPEEGGTLYVALVQDTPGEIGRARSEDRFKQGQTLDGEKYVLLQFDNPKSVQVLIDVLEDMQLRLSANKEEYIECLTER